MNETLLTDSHPTTYPPLDRPMQATLRLLLLATPVVAGSLLATATAANDRVEYNRDVRPVLANSCFVCHGPAANKGGMRLDLRESAFKPAKSGEIPIVPGKPQIEEATRA